MITKNYLLQLELFFSKFFNVSSFMKYFYSSSFHYHPIYLNKRYIKKITDLEFLFDNSFLLY